MAAPGNRKRDDIWRAPLGPLSVGQRCFLKSLLVGCRHLVTVVDSDNLALADDPVIIALNHNCSFETILVPAFLVYLRQGRLFSTVSDWMYGHLPVIGWLLRQTEPVYVYHKPSTLPFLNKRRPHAGSGSIIPECLARLEQGRSIMIFPEGTRNKNPLSLLKGRPGIGHLALTSGAPVLPIGIDFPPPPGRGRTPHFGPFILRIGKPLTFPTEIDALGRSSAAPAVNRTGRKKAYSLANQVTYAIMAELARLSGKIYPYPPPRPTLE